MKEKITLVANLPFIQVSISHQGRSKIIDNVLIDTGSGSTIFKVDILEDIGIKPEEDDVIATIQVLVVQSLSLLK
jgi:predicted aspartyl protease